MELKRLMVEGAKPYLPDVPPLVTKPMLARCWSKKVNQVWKIGKPDNKHKPFDGDDVLVPWDPEHVCGCQICVVAREKQAAKEAAKLSSELGILAARKKRQRESMRS